MTPTMNCPACADEPKTAPSFELDALLAAMSSANAQEPLLFTTAVGAEVVEW